MCFVKYLTVTFSVGLPAKINNPVPASQVQFQQFLVIESISLEERNKRSDGGALLHKCRSRQMLGGAKDFCPNSPKPSQKNSTITLKWKHVGRHFCSYFREFSQIFRDFVKVCRDFAQISTDFTRVLRDFTRIFTKSQHLGLRLHLLHPRLLHQCTPVMIYNFLLTVSLERQYRHFRLYAN